MSVSSALRLRPDRDRLRPDRDRLLCRLLLPASPGRGPRREVVLVAALRPPRLRRLTVLRWSHPAPDEDPAPAA